MAQIGFGGQWIEIFRVGDHIDNSGKAQKITTAFIDCVVANFSVAQHEPPLVVGHPKENSPAFGWAKELRRNGDSLECKFGDTDDEFERLVREGKYRKRSASFYLEPPVLRHVGFLGAQPPAVKGLREIQFDDEGAASVTFEISFSEDDKKMEEKDVEKVAESVWDKLKNMFKTEKDAAPQMQMQTAQFSEGQIAEAVKAAMATTTASFSEKLTALETQNATLAAANLKLAEQIGTVSASGKRAEIASFVESIPAEKGKHFLKRAGIAEFMESLADADDADGATKAINFSEGETKHEFSRVEWFKNYLGAQQSFVEFGEKFGALTATAEADAITDSAKMKEMRAAMGIDKTGGDK